MTLSSREIMSHETQIMAGAMESPVTEIRASTMAIVPRITLTHSYIKRRYNLVDIYNLSLLSLNIRHLISNAMLVR